jgi:hypothetical protein
MSYTIQKWDNNTAEIVYKLYAFDTDFIIEKEVLTGTSTESTYYNSNVSRETMAAAWTARASKTYDYELKESLVDNRFNRNFLALQDSYSCSLFESARKGINIKVEDFPLLWIEGNGGSGYYDSYTGDTFQISGNGCVFGGDDSNYNLIQSITLGSKSLTTNFTNTFLSKFSKLNYLNLNDNENISTLNISSLLELKDLFVNALDISSLDFTNNTKLEILNAFQSSISGDFADLNITSVLITQLHLHQNSITDFNASSYPLLNDVQFQGNELTAATNSQILIDLDTNNLSNGYYRSTKYGGGSLTSAGTTAKSNLQGKGWTIVGV